jgi:hypothetical protein
LLVAAAVAVHLLEVVQVLVVVLVDLELAHLHLIFLPHTRSQ